MKYLLILVLASSLGCATASDLKDLKPGMSEDEVNQHLGSPSSAEFKAGKATKIYHLRFFSKPMQWTFAIFYGLVFIPYQSYTIEYDDTGKLVSYYKR